MCALHCIFCCLRCNVEAFFYKQESLMRGAASSVSRDQQTSPLSAIDLLHCRNVDDTQRCISDRFQIQILVENFAPFRVVPVGILPSRLVCKTSLESCGNPMVRKLEDTIIRFNRTRTWQTPRQTDVRTDRHRTADTIAN